MARVAWTTLEGPEAEAVLSILLYNEHPRATRIRPSRGDYGIDVLVPRQVGNTEIWDVYQIKKFATNLDDSQKRKIAESFRRLMIGLVRRNIPVGDWYLVMPLDPTIGNLLDWFKPMPDTVIEDMFAQKKKLPISAEEKKQPLTDEERQVIEAWRHTPGRIIHWHGLDYCQNLVANHWYVTDYYLNGGDERVRNAVAEVGKILQRDRPLPDHENSSETSLLTPAEITGHLWRLRAALDGDPHFRYGIDLKPYRPPLVDEPDLVAATQEIAPDGSCLTFTIYQRFDEALNERPIPIRLQFNFEDTGFDQDSFDLWRKYGTPFTAPATIDIDLPGGLARNGQIGRVQLSPVDTEPYEIRLRAAPPNETAGPELRFTMASTTGPDSTGVWARGTDPSGLLMTEGFFDTETDRSTLKFSMRHLTGIECAEALPAVEFITALTQPNRLQIAEKYGPFVDAMPVPSEQELIDPLMVRYLRALSILQTRTATPILIPDLDNLSFTDWHNTISSASLVQGQVVVGTWKPIEFGQDTTAENHIQGHCQLVFHDDLVITIGTQEITLPGVVRTTLHSANIEDLGDNRVQASPHLNDTAHRQYAPNATLPDRERRRIYGKPIPDNAEDLGRGD